MRRRRFIVLVVGGVALLWPSASPAQTSRKGPTPGQGGRTEPTLQETLEKGLKVRRPQDFAFIARVIQLVKTGVLPERMVRSTFLWARRKIHREFQFFERAITLRAAKRGVRI